MNYSYTLKQILLAMLGIWAVGFGVSYFLSPMYVFHITNPMIIAMGVVLILVYGAGVVDAWKNRFEGITPAHLLTFGVVLNWLGMNIRMLRWFVTGQHPSVTGDIDFWMYNFGLWISMWAGLFLLGASRLAVRPAKVSILIVIYVVVFAVLWYWGYQIPMAPFEG